MEAVTILARQASFLQNWQQAMYCNNSGDTEEVKIFWYIGVSKLEAEGIALEPFL